jgi:hypothetical protein
VASRVSEEDRRRLAAERLAAAQELLASEVAALVSGEDWQRFLGFQARLHAYSPGNVLLIAYAHEQAFRAGAVGSPDPGYVAGFVTWRDLGRRVERGQHGYPILAPCRVRQRVAVEPGGGSRPLGWGESPGEGEAVETRQMVARFRVERVFSIHQTSGRPVPEVDPPRLLTGEAPAGLAGAVVGLLERRGFRVGAVADAAAIEGANGVTRWDTREVLVRADTEPAGVLKTLLHETGHALLHGEGPGRGLPREVKEVEAESVAFVVAAAHGMATDAYSFPYVAGWAGEHGPAVVRATQARVAQAARVIVEASPAAHTPGGRPPGVPAMGPAAGRTGRDQGGVGRDASEVEGVGL